MRSSPSKPGRSKVSFRKRPALRSSNLPVVTRQARIGGFVVRVRSVGANSAQKGILLPLVLRASRRGNGTLYRHRCRTSDRGTARSLMQHKCRCRKRSSTWPPTLDSRFAIGKIGATIVLISSETKSTMPMSRRSRLPAVEIWVNSSRAAASLGLHGTRELEDRQVHPDHAERDADGAADEPSQNAPAPDGRLTRHPPRPPQRRACRVSREPGWTSPIS